MKMKWAADPLRAILGRDEPTEAPAPVVEVPRKDVRPHAARATAEERPDLHTWFNALVVAGPAAAVEALHQSLTHTQPLPWRATEEVEREVVHLAMVRSGRRIEGLTLEDVLQACELVEQRHLIDTATLERHFRNLWHTSSAYCKQYMRGLLARKPGDHASGGRALTAGGGLFREGFSLTRIVLPPFRVLQGSYRYAGRTWCQRNWGTPEDAQLLNRRAETLPDGQRLMVYEFETVEGAPLGVLARLVQRYPALSVYCICVDGDTGARIGLGGHHGRLSERRDLSPVAVGENGIGATARRDAVRGAREAVLPMAASETFVEEAPLRAHAAGA